MQQKVTEAETEIKRQNFDCALSHPDANDLEKLKEAVMDPSF
jgi:flavodoxin I